MTKNLCFEYETDLRFAGYVSMHSFKLRIRPPENDRQRLLRYDKLIYPPPSLWESEDSFGNPAYCGIIDFKHDRFGFKISGIAEVKDTPFYRDECLPVYKYPSSLTKASDEITEFCRSVRSSADGDILHRALFFADKVYNTIEYCSGSTGVGTTAAQAFSQRRGVCQDMAHILLALLRLENIPCRYAAGMSSEDGETHAWAEVWQDGLWYGIDPTRNKLTDEYYIKLSHGRDFNDCPIEKGVYRGCFGSSQSVSVRMEEVICEG